MVVIHGHAEFVKGLHLQYDIPKLDTDVYYESSVQGGPQGLMESITDPNLQNQLAILQTYFREAIQAPLLVNRYTHYKASFEDDTSDVAFHDALDREAVCTGKFSLQYIYTAHLT